MDLELSGKIALITGASRGIGLSIARALSAEVCHLGLCARDAATLEAVAAELSAAGRPVLALPADVLDPAQAERFVAQCAAQLGGIDILINNVGGSTGGGLLAATDDDWRQTFEQTVFQAVRLMRLCAPHLRQRGGGVIVNIASISGMRPAAGGLAQYGGAKAALIFITEQLALELVPDQIRVNAVSPGSVMLPGGYWDRVRAQQPEAFAAYAQAGFPMGRLGTPEEIAEAVAFICSPRAAWINGRNIPVDGLQQPAAWRGDRRQLAAASGTAARSSANSQAPTGFSR